MINRFLKLFYIDKTKVVLTKEQEAGILHDIEIINFRRMRVLFTILLIIETLFIVFNDIYNLLNTGNVIWNDKRLFIFHLVLLIISLVGIMATKSILGDDRYVLKEKYKIVVPGLTMIFLVLMSFINGLDEIGGRNVSSVFIADTLICSACILMRFPMNLVVYGVSFLSYFITLVFFEKGIILMTNVINGVIFFIAVLIISKVIYDSHYDQMAKNIILNYMSNHDPLTGLSNRRDFENKAKQKMDIINQQGYEAALILMDIDYFKQLNDEFGHPIGDKVLKEVSNILIENVNSNDLITRWGGEEFLMLISQVSIDKACELADKIRRAIGTNAFVIDGIKVCTTASFGVSPLKGDFLSSFDASYKLADKALYQAKNQGRNQVVYTTS